MNLPVVGSDRENQNTEHQQKMITDENERISWTVTYENTLLHSYHAGSSDGFLLLVTIKHSSGSAEHDTLLSNLGKLLEKIITAKLNYHNYYGYEQAEFLKSIWL